MLCRKCGNQLPEGVKFCHKCGTKVVFEKSVQQATNESVVADGCSDHYSSVVDSQSFQTASNEKLFNRLYDESIKPYYREQFDRIASGQKTKFNWAALFLNGWIQLYNGCTRIFCKTFLPLLVAGFVVSLTGIVGVLQLNLTVMMITQIFAIMISFGNIALSIINGFRFNKWYFQDVVNNQGKKRSRRGFWILLICEAIAIVVLSVLPHILLSRLDDDDYAVYFDDENIEYRYDLDGNESIILTQTYANEDEGFSFMYPYNWGIENVEEVNPDALVSLACTGMLGTYARITVEKEIDDGAYFAAIEPDFEEAYSSSGVFSDVNVMDLSDTVLDGCPVRKLTLEANNDNGVRCVLIQYFYINDSYVYGVTLAAEKDNYGRYEPEFDAIMESYTITTVDISDSAADDAVFGEALVQLIVYNTLPDGSIANDLNGKIDGMYDKFAICDIDQNGEKELLVNISSGSISAAGIYIYEVNTAHTGLDYVWSFDTSATFYDTGFVKEDWSHNQGLAYNFWPYNVFQKTNDGYIIVGSADAWEKTHIEFDFSGDPFPDEVDLNENGIVYFVSDENGIDYDNPVDDAEYKEFEKSFFGDGDTLYVPWQSLELDNIKAATGIEYGGDGYEGDVNQDDNSLDSDDFWEGVELSDFSYENLYLYSGIYEGINQTSIHVNIYSSFDEGNIVGNVFLYDSSGYETFALIIDDNEGEGIYTLCLDDSTVLYIGFYQDFYGEYYADILGLDNIYTNVNEIETYVMTEQYIS